MRSLVKYHLIASGSMLFTIVLSVLSISGIFLTSWFMLLSMLFFVSSLVELSLIAYSFYGLDKRKKKKWFIVLTGYLVPTVGLLLLVESIEFIFSWMFVYKFTYWPYYIALIIYPFIIWLLVSLQLLIKSKMWHKILGVGFVVGTLAVGYMNIFIAMLGTQLTTNVVFEERDIELVLVESGFIFSSHHELYLRVNPLFVEDIYQSGSWECDDGCPIGSPDSYKWTWINDTTLEVSSDSMFEPKIFYFTD